MTRKKFQPPTDEEIARYAYCLWESEGQIHGRDLDYWLQAKTHLTTTREYEAGLLNTISTEESTAKEPQAAPVFKATHVVKSPRRRQSRSVPEAVYA